MEIRNSEITNPYYLLILLYVCSAARAEIVARAETTPAVNHNGIAMVRKRPVQVPFDISDYGARI